MIDQQEPHAARARSNRKRLVVAAYASEQLLPTTRTMKKIWRMGFEPSSHAAGTFVNKRTQRLVESKKPTESGETPSDG